LRESKGKYKFKFLGYIACNLNNTVDDRASGRLSTGGSLIKTGEPANLFRVVIPSEAV